MPTSSPVPTVAWGDFLYIAPEIALTAWGLLVLLVDVMALRGQPNERRRTLLGGLSLLGALVALGLVFYDLPTVYGVADTNGDPILFFGTIAGDSLTVTFNGVIAAMLGLVIALSMAWTFTDAWGEYYALLLWAAVGMMLLIASEELLTLFLTLETMTLCLYMASAFEKSRPRSPEAGLKYFVYGSVSSALFLFGLSLIFGLTGSTRLDSIHLLLRTPLGDDLGLAQNLAGATAVLLVLVGFGFKIAAVPFHQWAPDAYEGAPAPVAAWIASGSKVASFIALMKVMNHALSSWSIREGDLSSVGWMRVVALIAALSMTYGNLAALAQRNFKRLLAYSSIAHAGYLLVGVLAISVKPANQAAGAAVLYYLVVYAFTSIGAFAVAAWLARDLRGDDIDDLNGLGRQLPFLGVCIVLLMLSLIGIPPMGGFFGKLYMFLEALNSGENEKLSLTWLVALALANSVISAFYYVKVLVAMYLRPASRRAPAEPPLTVSVPIVLATLVALVLGLAPAPIMDSLTASSIPMLMVNARTAAGRGSEGMVPGAPASPSPPAPSPPPSTSAVTQEAPSE